MPLDHDLQRVETAMEQLSRVSRSRRGDAERAGRAGVHLPRAAQMVLRQTVETGPVRISDLARALHMSDAAASRTVTTLEGEGLLSRSGSPDDGRVALVAITPRGRRVQRRLREAQDEIFAGTLSHWPRQDVARLADLMERLAADLRTLPTSEGAPSRRGAAGARR
jgi:DNA-binding MarR family transcriptional regulator